MQYLQDLECPLPFETDAVPSLLDWLLHHAISLEYQDAGRQLLLVIDALQLMA